MWQYLVGQCNLPQNLATDSGEFPADMAVYILILQNQLIINQLERELQVFSRTKHQDYREDGLAPINTAADRSSCRQAFQPGELQVPC